MAELLIVWGVLAVLATTVGIGDNPLEPLLLRASEQSYDPNETDSDTEVKHFTVTVVALSANVAAVAAAVLLYAILTLRRERPDSRTDARRKLTSFLFLWLTNAAGAAEFVLIFSFVGPPTFVNFDSDCNFDDVEAKLQQLAIVYTWILLGYACFVVTWSAFTISLVPLRIAEDLFLLSFAAFACYLLVLDRGIYKPEQFLVALPGKAPQSCASLFPRNKFLEGKCRDDVEQCVMRRQGAGLEEVTEDTL